MNIGNHEAQKILIRMKLLINEDTETRHMIADDLLLELIRLDNVDISIREEIINVFNSLNKWYA